MKNANRTGLRGRIITWFIPNDFKTNATELESLGIKKLPTNAPKTVLKKAVDTVKKLIERDVKLPPSEKARKVQTPAPDGHQGYALVVPYLDSDRTYRTKTALSVSVHKAHATLEFRQIDCTDSDFENLSNKIRALYNFERDSIDSEQFRSSVMKRYIDNIMIPTKHTGGSYFIAERYENEFQNLKTIFDHFEPTGCYLTVYNCSDDDETLASIESDTHRKFQSDFATFEADIQKAVSTGQLNTVTFRKMKERFQNKILPKAMEHKENLRSKFAELENRADSMIEVMKNRLESAAGDVVAVFDFGAAMVAIANGEPVENTEPDFNIKANLVFDDEPSISRETVTPAPSEPENDEPIESDIDRAMRLAKELDDK